MADEQPNDVEEIPVAKSAEDRKAASALAKLDARVEDGPAREVDEKAVSEAMKSLAGDKGAAGALPVRPAAKNVKVDPVDVGLLVDELDLPKNKATELLKAHDGDAVKAMAAFVQVKF